MTDNKDLPNVTDQIITDAVLRQIFDGTKTIGLVGASAKPERASHGVMRFLQQHGYRVIPVNPGLEGQMLNGERVYASLADTPEAKAGTIDMVDIFRNSADALDAARDAIKIGAKTVWMQLGVINETAAAEARAAGLTVVMDRCPAIEIPRLHGGHHAQ